MNGVQCYELFGEVALINYALLNAYIAMNNIINGCMRQFIGKCF